VRILWRPFSLLFDFNLTMVVLDQIVFLVLMRATFESIVQNLEVVLAVGGDVHEVFHVGVQICEFALLLVQNCFLLAFILINEMLGKVLEFFGAIALVLATFGLLPGWSESALLDLLAELLRSRGQKLSLRARITFRTS